MRAVLDTNVVVSGLFFGGPPRGILDAWADGDLEVIITPSILVEYRRVCDRMCERYPSADLQTVLIRLFALGTLIPDPAHDVSVTEDHARCERLARSPGPDAEDVSSQPQALSACWCLSPLPTTAESISHNGSGLPKRPHNTAHTGTLRPTAAFPPDSPVRSGPVGTKRRQARSRKPGVI